MKTTLFLTLAAFSAMADARGGEKVAALLEAHCADCHGADEPEGEFSLEPFAAIDAAAWQRILEQVATDEMPPKKRRRRPAFAEREQLIAHAAAEIEKAGKTPLLPGGPRPEDGNLVDHERLFSGKYEGPASSPPRFWRTSQPQYDALMEQLWVIPKLRYEKAVDRNDPKWAAFSYSKPFPALDPENFTDYAGEVHADDAALRSLMNAGAQIAERLTADRPAYAVEIQPWNAVGQPSVRRGHPWERFKVEPPKRPPEFEPFLAAGAKPTDDQRQAAVRRVFRLLMNREVTGDEAQRYGGLLDRCVAKSGAPAGLRGLITAVIVSPEFVFRMEVGMGAKDEHGRRMLSPDELVYAIGYALSDAGPDEELWDVAKAGRLATRADVEREVRRLLADGSIEKQRRLRFFQEFFGYPQATEIFKDKQGWGREVKYLVRDADLLVEHVLEKDEDVLAELLTTDRYFVAFPVIEDPELFQAVIDRTLEETRASIKKTEDRGKPIEAHKQGRYSRAWILKQGLNPIPRTVHNDPKYFETAYIATYGFDGNTFDWTRDQPIEVPGKRAGMLTHPAWLVAHSANTDNDVVGRGHWIRERLLAGKVPDVPIEVEARVPEEPDSTLRERMRVTRESYCLRCHTRMDPLGFPFEMYDHYGRYRTEEMVGARKNQPRPIDTSGAILVSGEPGLDGPVEDAIGLVHKLAKSDRVRQSFVRHAFRFWMGRNEQLTDSPTLIAADRAYVDGGGSFTELLVSLLTSDSFLYRK